MVQLIKIIERNVLSMSKEKQPQLNSQTKQKPADMKTLDYWKMMNAKTCEYESITGVGAWKEADTSRYS